MSKSRNRHRSLRSIWKPTRKRSVGVLVLLATLSGVVWVFWPQQYADPPIEIDRLLTAVEQGGAVGRLSIDYPYDGTLFPPDIIAPEFQWDDSRTSSNLWLITIEFSDGTMPMGFVSTKNRWIPSNDDWQTFKEHSVEQQATVTISGFDRHRQHELLSNNSISICTSTDEVGAPIFYREVSLPFRTAVMNTAKHIRWRFGSISSDEIPPVVLDDLPVCGNCHSFSADGQTLAMEVDSGNDKASYAVAPIRKEIILGGNNLMTWADYRRQDGQLTFGLLCQVAPDGRHVVGTVKDRALAVYRDNLMFSQLFFIVKGFLAIYDRQSQEYHALPGADDPDFVQTNGVWSPDGKEIVFAKSRSPALDPPELRNIKTVIVPPQVADNFVSKGETFLYDLYRIPFNGGAGGEAIPVLGASNNGTSNYFPKFSPDGKWIVFCRAKSFMLLQPDSELFIIPAEGGEARRLQCNTTRMNSWHSWSPNSKWLVFSSKVNSAYTQLFLTHIDDDGNSSPPVLLRHFTAPRKAANIPEFVNASADAIVKIREQFLEEHSFLKIGGGAAFYGDYDLAIHWFKKALALNPRSAAAYENWGAALSRQKKLPEAATKLQKALELSPGRTQAHIELGHVLKQLGMVPEAIQHYRQAVRLDTTAALPHYYLGNLLIETGNRLEGEQQLAEARRLDPQVGSNSRVQRAAPP
jgi:hypothetical protein